MLNCEYLAPRYFRELRPISLTTRMREDSSFLCTEQREEGAKTSLSDIGESDTLSRK